MPDPFDLLWRWRRQISFLVVLTVGLTTAIVFLMPRQYLGQATALPAPAYAADKTVVFSQNLQSVYSMLGSQDDLDRILGTAQLDTVYDVVANQWHLASHYDLNNGGRPDLRRSALRLKNKTRVMKGDYGELKVKVWDKDAVYAANLANSIMEKLQQIHQDIQTVNNAMMLATVNSEYANKKIEYQRVHDSLSQMQTATTGAQILLARQASLIQQIEEYENLSGQYQLMVHARPKALVIVEKASPAIKADRPHRAEIIVAAAVLSFLFAFLAAVVLERRKSQA
jgi:hypothetical protein